MVMEIITTVTIRIGGIELNTKSLRQLRQASVSWRKAICWDGPAPLLAFGELREEKAGGTEVAPSNGSQTWLCLS